MNHRDAPSAGAALAVGTVAADTTTAAVAPAAPPPGKDHALRVHIVVFDGVEELDVFGPLQVVGAAAAIGYPVDFRLVTSGRPGEITARHGTKIRVTDAWDPEKADVIVVPGGGFGRKEGPGIWEEIKKGLLTRALRQAAADEHLTLYGLCTGVIVLYEAGVIGDRPCTTARLVHSYLKDRGADVRDVRVVDDGNLVCASGVSSGIDGTLRLIDREFGTEAAARTERYLEFERRGTVLVTSTGRTDV